MVTIVHTLNSSSSSFFFFFADFDPLFCPFPLLLFLLASLNTQDFHDYWPFLGNVRVHACTMYHTLAVKDHRVKINRKNTEIRYAEGLVRQRKITCLIKTLADSYMSTSVSATSFSLASQSESSSVFGLLKHFTFTRQLQR